MWTIGTGSDTVPVARKMAVVGTKVALGETVMVKSGVAVGGLVGVVMMAAAGVALGGTVAAGTGVALGGLGGVVVMAAADVALEETMVSRAGVALEELEGIVIVAATRVALRETVVATVARPVTISESASSKFLISFVRVVLIYF